MPKNDNIVMTEEKRDGATTKKEFYKTLGMNDRLRTRLQRTQFANFMDENYNLNVQTYYRKLRQKHMEEWELKGLLTCVAEFEAANRIQAAPDANATGIVPDGETSGTVEVTVAQWNIYEWFAQCDKMKFYDFMAGKGLCRDTIKKHMDDEDWTRLNLRGWRTAWKEYKEIHSA